MKKFEFREPTPEEIAEARDELTEERISRLRASDVLGASWFDNAGVVAEQIIKSWAADVSDAQILAHCRERQEFAWESAQEYTREEVYQRIFGDRT